MCKYIYFYVKLIFFEYEIYDYIILFLICFVIVENCVFIVEMNNNWL